MAAAKFGKEGVPGGAAAPKDVKFDSADYYAAQAKLMEAAGIKGDEEKKD